MLEGSDQALSERFDLAMLDLDGVVYIGGEAVPGAPDHLARARESGLRLAFVTNNASRSPGTVAEHLARLGVEADPDDVVSSAQAAAHLLLDRFGEGARVAVLGADGLRDALRERGLEPVAPRDEAVALVTGYGPEVVWRDIMRAAVRIRDGLPWVASNTDMTIPTDEGVAPGHGVLVETLSRFADVEPDVAGKPAPPLLRETIERTGAERPLMVGDRLDTDIEGGAAVDVPTLLVMTGVTGLTELVSAAPALRPTFLAPDLGGLLQAHPEPEHGDGGWRVGGWTAHVDGDRLAVDGDGEPGDWWRAVASAAWAHLDESGDVAGHDHLEPPGSGAPDEGGHAPR